MANARKSLSLYAERAGISKEAARKRLARLGINYTQPFDFDDADRRFTEARHASRVAFSKSAPGDCYDDEQIDEETKKDPRFIESQARREQFKANITEVEYLTLVGELVPAKDVDKEWVDIAQMVKANLLNIPPRIVDQLRSEPDQNKWQDIIEAEIYQVLEALDAKESAGTPL